MIEMNEKITKKNSILFNQLWINKAIEDGNSFVLIYNKSDDRSIGEIIEERYLEEDLEPKSKKVTEHDSLLFQREWLKKYRDENLPIPNRKIAGKYSLGQILSLRYFEMEIIENFKASQKEKVLELK